jgi:hypothetical protein
MPASCLRLPLSHRLLLSHWWPQQALLTEFPPAGAATMAWPTLQGLAWAMQTLSLADRGDGSAAMGLGLVPSTQASANVRVSAPALALLLVQKALKLSGPLWPPSCPPKLQAAQAAGAAGAASSSLSTEPPTASPEACWGQLASWTAGCNKEADQVLDMPGCCWGLRAQGCWISACCTHPPNEFAPACAPAAGSGARWPRRCRGQQRWRALGDACGTLHSTC